MLCCGSEPEVYLSKEDSKSMDELFTPENFDESLRRLGAVYSEPGSDQDEYVALSSMLRTSKATMSNLSRDLRGKRRRYTSE